MSRRPARPQPVRPRASRRPVGWIAWAVAALATLALAGQTVRSLDRLTASRALWRVEILSRSAVAAGRSSRELFAQNLQTLSRVAPLDPLEVGIPLARGAQYLLLGSGEAAEEAYFEALRLEPRPEVYLNLGRAQLLAGHQASAKQSFATAVKLDPNLAPYVPAAGR